MTCNKYFYVTASTKFTLIPSILCVPASRLLLFIVSHKGIMVDPLKVQAILDLPSSKTQHQLQSLQGKANFLHCFVPEYATKSYGFIRLLHTKSPLFGISKHKNRLMHSNKPWLLHQISPRTSFSMCRPRTMPSLESWSKKTMLAMST